MTNYKILEAIITGRLAPVLRNKYGEDTPEQMVYNLYRSISDKLHNLRNGSPQKNVIGELLMSINKNQGSPFKDDSTQTMPDLSLMYCIPEEVRLGLTFLFKIFMCMKMNNDNKKEITLSSTDDVNEIIAKFRVLEKTLSVKSQWDGYNNSILAHKNDVPKKEEEKKPVESTKKNQNKKKSVNNKVQKKKSDKKTNTANNINKNSRIIYFEQDGINTKVKSVVFSTLHNDAKVPFYTVKDIYNEVKKIPQFKSVINKTMSNTPLYRTGAMSLAGKIEHQMNKKTDDDMKSIIKRNVQNKIKALEANGEEVTELQRPYMTISTCFRSHATLNGFSFLSFFVLKSL